MDFLLSQGCSMETSSAVELTAMTWVRAMVRNMNQDPRWGELAAVMNRYGAQIE